MAGIKGGLVLQRIPLLRNLSHSSGPATVTSRLSPFTTTNTTNSKTTNNVLITHRRIFAGRSPSSIRSTEYSYNSRSQISSRRSTSRNISSISSASIQTHPINSKCSSVDTGISSQSSQGRYGKSRRSDTKSGSHSVRAKSRRCGKSLREPLNGRFYSEDQSKLFNHDDERERKSFRQFQRRSRWDEYQAHKHSSISPPQRTRSVSVEHRGNPTLIPNDREFMELKKNRSAQTEWNKRFPEGTIVVYTDGSCIDNRASGFGIYFGPNHELNRSERIIGPIHNSGLAEILAAQMALRTLRDWRGYKNEPVILRTDFLPLVQAMNGDGTYERFSEEMDKVRSLALSFPNGVSFQHVYAHDGDPGNEQADTLARIATAPARRCRSESIPRFRRPMNRYRCSRSRSRSRNWRRRGSRSASREINRSRSRNNDPHHVRSHSAFVLGRRR